MIIVTLGDIATLIGIAIVGGCWILLSFKMRRKSRGRSDKETR